MDFGSGRAIEIAPFHSRGSLKGFVVSGRWPDSTKEWAQLLMAAVRVASLPGLLSTTTIFGVREELPEEPEPGTVGLVLAEGTVVGDAAVGPGHFAQRQPPALMMLHPPSETTPSLPECNGAASGCVLLPGLPHLGLEHRAAWVEAESASTPSATPTPPFSRCCSPPEGVLISNFRLPEVTFRLVEIAFRSGGLKHPRLGSVSSAKGSSPQSSSRHTGVSPAGEPPRARGGRDLRP